MVSLPLQIVTKSRRYYVTHTEKKIWHLRIRDIRESDKGWYMCQINTDPMKSQMGYLNVVGKYMYMWFKILKNNNLE